MKIELQRVYAVAGFVTNKAAYVVVREGQMEVVRIDDYGTSRITHGTNGVIRDLLDDAGYNREKVLRIYKLDAELVAQLKKEL